MHSLHFLSSLPPSLPPHPPPPPPPLQSIYEWFDIGFDKFGRTPTRAQTEIGQVRARVRPLARLAAAAAVAGGVAGGVVRVCVGRWAQAHQRTGAGVLACLPPRTLIVPFRASAPACRCSWLPAACPPATLHPPPSTPPLLPSCPSSPPPRMPPPVDLPHPGAARVPGGADHGAAVQRAAGQVPGRQVGDGGQLLLCVGVRTRRVQGGAGALDACRAQRRGYGMRLGACLPKPHTHALAPAGRLAGL